MNWITWTFTILTVNCKYSDHWLDMMKEETQKKKKKKKKMDDLSV